MIETKQTATPPDRQCLKGWRSGEWFKRSVDYLGVEIALRPTRGARKVD